jgi:hypothetical protein
LTNTTRGAFPTSFTDNPLKWEEFVASFSARQVAAAIVISALFTAIGEGISWLLQGHPSADGTSGVVVPWMFVGAIAVTIVLSRRHVLTSRGRRIPAVLWLHAVLQIFWIAALAFYTEPVFSVVLAVGLCSLAFHDARYFYNARFLHLYYLLVWPAFLVVLVAVDVVGGRGLLARVAAQPHYLRAAVPITLTVMLNLQLIVAVVGRQWRELDGKLWAFSQAQAQLAEMRREREVIARSCDFLVQGITAGRFSHDVASPISTVALSAAELSSGLGTLRENLAAHLSARPDLAELLDQLQGAVARISRGQMRLHDMTMNMARSLRGEVDTRGRSIEDVVRASLGELQTALARHEARYIEPNVQLASAEVYVTDEHAAAIGSIMCNGFLQSPLTPLQVTGHPADSWFYVLAIRDFGVAVPERAEALGRVRRSLTLADAEPRAVESRTYEGLGMGLVLAKLLFVRNNGWLGVMLPESDRGLVFLIVLPRHPTSEIPVAENTPELAAERWSAPLAGAARPEA